MKLEIGNKKYKFNTYQIDDIVDDVLDDIDGKEECIYQEDYVIREVDNLIDNINKYGKCFSSSFSIKKLREKIYRIIINGRLGDILGFIYTFSINTIATPLIMYEINDKKLIRYLRGEMNSNSNPTSFSNDRFNIGKSLILEYISDLNGGINNGTVSDRLTGLSPDVYTDLIEKSFIAVYGIEMKDVPEKKSDVPDLLSLDNINDEVLKHIEDEVRSSITRSN